MTTNSDLIAIEQALTEYFAEKKDKIPDALYKAMVYSVFSEGKRVRPYLMMLSADFLDVPRNKVMPIAVALELIHTYSLIHDDLPCMDNDDFRRGRPSSHKAYGEAMALLAGDALLNMAHEIMFEAVEKDHDLAQSAVFIAKSAGAEGMVGGQAIEFSVDEFDETTITELCLKKTGALISAAILAPAYIACDGEKFSALGTYAKAVGLNFQLCDDILDMDKQEKKSYLGVMGEQNTVEMIKRLDTIAKKALAKYGESALPLTEFSEFLTNRKK